MILLSKNTKQGTQASTKKPACPQSKLASKKPASLSQASKPAKAITSKPAHTSLSLKRLSLEARLAAILEKIINAELIDLKALALDYGVSLRTLQRDFAVFKVLPLKKISPSSYALRTGGGALIIRT